MNTVWSVASCCNEGVVTFLSKARGVRGVGYPHEDDTLICFLAVKRNVEELEPCHGWADFGVCRQEDSLLFFGIPVDRGDLAGRILLPVLTDSEDDPAATAVRHSGYVFGGFLDPGLLLFRGGRLLPIKVRRLLKPMLDSLYNEFKLGLSRSEAECSVNWGQHVSGSLQFVGHRMVLYGA